MFDAADCIPEHCLKRNWAKTYFLWLFSLTVIGWIDRQRFWLKEGEQKEIFLPLKEDSHLNGAVKEQMRCVYDEVDEEK
jgi:hypothetical protein